MKRQLTKLVGLVLVLSIMLTACGVKTEETAVEETPDTTVETSVEETVPESEEPAVVETTDVYLLAAASLTDVFGEIIPAFEAEHPEYKIIATYASSGTLQSQIEEGAPADVFMSAAEKQMNALAEQGLVMNDTRVALLENKLVLIAPASSTKNIVGFAALENDEIETIGMGEVESVPVGQYSKEVLETLGNFAAIEPKLVFGSDVRTVLTWVETEEVDVGMVYSTDAAISGDKVKVIETASPEIAKPIIYPIAQLENGENKDGAAEFLKFAQSTESLEKFKNYGFELL